jgi:hypothetical protein
VPITEEGDYRIHFVARLDPNGSAVQVRWDGEAAALNTGASNLVLHRSYRTLLRDFTIQSLHLAPGAHTLEFVWEGAGPEVERPEIALDFVWVQKVG